jgi:hypothetical protein
MLDNPELGGLTKMFFGIVDQEIYELVISPIVVGEINNAKVEKKESVLCFLDALDNLTRLVSASEAYSLAQNYLIEGVLTYNHIDDLLHMAYATVYQCDMIVSWNRKHLANPLKMQKLNKCNEAQGYSSIVICTPRHFINNIREE